MTMTKNELIEMYRDTTTNGSCHAYYVEDGVLWHYQTPIAVKAFQISTFTESGKDEWHLYLNKEKYSTTTTRLQNAVRKAFKGSKWEVIPAGERLLHSMVNSTSG